MADGIIRLVSAATQTMTKGILVLVLEAWSLKSPYLANFLLEGKKQSSYIVLKTISIT